MVVTHLVVLGVVASVLVQEVLLRVFIVVVLGVVLCCGKLGTC